MTLRCFFLGCCWNKGMTFWNGGEKLQLQYCSRCDAQRVVSE